MPGLVGEAEIRSIAALLPPGADWEIAPFVTGHCLDDTWNDVEPYGPVERARLVSIARELVPGARLR